MVRFPAVAGQFYSGDPERLRSELEGMITPAPAKDKVIGIVAPHAGHIYSGPVAGRVYGAIEVPQAVIILGPNHHGFGPPAALCPEREWLTPLGSVSANTRLAGLVQKHAPLVELDSTAHHHEHSLEVQVPFLQIVRPDVTIVPLCLGFGDFARCRSLGKGIAQAIRAYGNDVLIVASSDMSHFESAEAARKKDELAIREVLALNPQGLLRVCRDEGITMCGVIPTVVMLVAALELGAAQAKLVHYATSGEVTGDHSHVVAYAALEVS